MAAWAQSWQRRMTAMTRRAVKTALKTAAKTVAKTAAKTAAKRAVKTAGRTRASGEGAWLPGLAISPSGVRGYRLYRPPGLTAAEHLPLLVMLHGCGQSAGDLAASTRMNLLADRERCWVLYPEQDRLVNLQGCWSWFETASGRADAEIAVLMSAIDQVCLRHPIDAERVAVAGLSAGASMAALMALKHPTRFRAVVMHSGIAPGLATSSASALSAMQGRRRAHALETLALLPPLLVIQGAADPVVAPSNGVVAARLWAESLGAVGAPPRKVQRGKRYPMTVTDFTQDQRVRVSQVEIAQLGHAWSGGAAAQAFSDPKGPDASRLLWAFVARQFKAVVRQRAEPVRRAA